MAILNQIPSKSIPLSKTKFTQYELYQLNAPVQLAGYFIYKETDTQQVIISKRISFGFRNTSDQPVIAIKGRFDQFDPFGESLGEVQYSLIEIENYKPGQVTGETLFMACHLSTTTIDFKIDQVIFQDGSKWIASSFESLSMAMPKQDILETDLEVMQYGWGVMARGVPLKNYYVENEHFYRCPCGTVNPLNKTACPLCKVEKQSAQSFYNAEASKALVQKMVKEVLFQINRLFPDAVYLDTGDQIRFTENAVLFADKPLEKLKEFATYWKGVHPLIKTEIKQKGEFLKSLDKIQKQLVQTENEKNQKAEKLRKAQQTKKRNKILLIIGGIILTPPFIVLLVYIFLWLS